MPDAKPEERILTQHPLGKRGVRIARAKYDLLKRALLASLGRKELTHPELLAEIERRLKGKFDGNIGWYAESVKLDLEARGIIERTASKPQRYRRT